MSVCVFTEASSSRFLYLFYSPAQISKKLDNLTFLYLTNRIEIYCYFGGSLDR